MADIPACPPTLKAIQHYLKIAQEHASRDPVVSYWSQLYALQTALTIDRKSDESKGFLVKMMDGLEAMKKELKENEAITNEVAAQAHIENYALKLFVWADSQDRAANFGKNVVKAFYTSGMLFDVLTTFGELSEEIQQNRKYAKWKAAYIHNCLKNGETPVPGPMKSEEDEEGFGSDAAAGPVNPNMQDGASNNLPSIPQPTSPGSSNATDDFGLPQVPPRFPNEPPNVPSQPILPSPDFGFNLPSTPAPQPVVQPAQPSNPSMPPGDSSWQPNSSGEIVLTAEQKEKASKWCKFAIGALTFDDIPTALSNLENAVYLLKNGTYRQ
ncbi:vacuolar protein sorting-associated protein VTA1 homolog [Thrips palmi]|uniref:Vacuolar protein sorting-associated protein VTA1 homolog n=1 Tax=Thrips palmi TaxID=161013 RepID=A0A6P8YEF8_THRPL|nr:vacuolar protein sorting-associated protein VTA1 homolog [Thrips palmi]